MALEINPPPGTRFPNFGDERMPFEPKGALKGRIDLPEMLGYHSPSERKYTLLGTHDEWITAAACFQVREADLFIDYLARNELFRAPTFVAAGSLVIAAIEGIAERLDRPLLRLESVEDPKTIEWYRQQGFSPDGQPRTEPGWGMLYPMAKRVEPFGAL